MEQDASGDETDDHDDAVWVHSLLAARPGKTYLLDPDPEGALSARQAAHAAARAIVEEVTASLEREGTEPPPT